MKHSVLAATAAAAAVLSLGLASSANAAEAEGPFYADIYVELDRPDSNGPMIFFVENVLVTDDGPELHQSGNQAVSNPSEFAGGALVDISADLQTVELGGGGEYGSFAYAYFEIQITGANWGTVTLTSDDIFEEWQQQQAQVQGGSAEPASFVTGLVPARYGANQGRIAFASPPAPTLEDQFGVQGNSFAAEWLGDESTAMSGSAFFAFGVPTAPPATPVAGDPDFTG